MFYLVSWVQKKKKRKKIHLIPFGEISTCLMKIEFENIKIYRRNYKDRFPIKMK